MINDEREFCIYVKLDRAQQQETKDAIVAYLWPQITQRDAEIDRLHDECNQRALKMEAVENNLRNVLGFEDDESAECDNVSALAAMHIEYLGSEILRLENDATFKEQKIAWLQGDLSLERKSALNICKVLCLAAYLIGCLATWLVMR